MLDWFAWQTIDAALLAALLVALLVSTVTRKRGGRFRGLVGWVGFWFVFAAILVCLTRGPEWLSITLLALMLFVCLRTYFFVVHMRRQDRWAILAAYLMVPLVTYLAFRSSAGTFLVLVTLSLVLVLPAILSLGDNQDGLLDAMGRMLLGGGLFLLCAPHLGLILGSAETAPLELLAILVVAAELPQRVAGRLDQGTGKLQRGIGIVLGTALAALAGGLLGPTVGLEAGTGLRAGLLVAAAVTLGAWVGTGAVRALTPGSPATRLVGRGAFLDRVIPAVYAAPVFFHYLRSLSG